MPESRTGGRCVATTAPASLPTTTGQLANGGTALLNQDY
jgi:hypothetical protein